MKEQKNNRKTGKKRFFHKNSASQRVKMGKSPLLEVAREVPLYQILAIKAWLLLGRLARKAKQIVLDLADSSGRRMLLWKAMVMVLLLLLVRDYTRDFSLDFRWPVVINKAGRPSFRPVEEVQELGIGSFLTSSDALPSALRGLDRRIVNQYIKHYEKVAIAEHHKFGIPASITMAQALLESRAGQSQLAAKNHNHFGIKCFSRKCKKGHCTNFSDDSHKDFFRIYKSAWESWRAHSLLLTSKRYRSLKSNGDDYRAWAKGLKKLGYATDPNYDKKLIEIIEALELYKLDSI